MDFYHSDCTIFLVSRSEGRFLYPYASTLILSKTVLRFRNALGISRMLATLTVQMARQRSGNQSDGAVTRACDQVFLVKLVNTSKRLRHNAR
jgi:hypothetical protein